MTEHIKRCETCKHCEVSTIVGEASMCSILKEDGQLMGYIFPQTYDTIRILGCASWKAEDDFLDQLVIDALYTDGGHHKQWYLEQIADALGIEHTIYCGHDEGIAP